MLVPSLTVMVPALRSTAVTRIGVVTVELITVSYINAVPPVPEKTLRRSPRLKL